MNENASQRQTGLLVFSWLFVGLPFAYGVAALLRNVIRLFTG